MVLNLAMMPKQIVKIKQKLFVQQATQLHIVAMDGKNGQELGIIRINHRLVSLILVHLVIAVQNIRHIIVVFAKVKKENKLWERNF